MFKDLDPLLHSQLRLAIMSPFNWFGICGIYLIKEETNSTAGNIKYNSTSYRKQVIRRLINHSKVKDLYRL